MFLPPVLRPLPDVGPASTAVQRIPETPVSIVRGVPGSYLAERLAGVIDRWGRLPDCVWLRARDRGRVGLAQALGGALRYRWPGAEPKQAPPAPPVPLSDGIRLAPAGAVVVLEVGGHMTAEVSQLVRVIRPALADRGASLVVVAESRFRLPARRGADWVAPAADLFGVEVPDRDTCGWDRTRLLRYAGPRPAVIHDVLAAGRQWSPGAVDEALRTSHDLSSFLARLTAVLLAELTPDQRSALGVALATGYWHPALGTRPVATGSSDPGWCRWSSSGAGCARSGPRHCAGSWPGPPPPDRARPPPSRSAR